MVNFKDFFRKSSVFIIDDIQFIRGKESLQEEFFHTFNSLMDKGSQIVISADRTPMKLDRVQERIKSRLAGGLVVDIDTPDLELKVKIIKKRILEIENQFKENINLNDDVINYIANESKTNIRELEGAIISLMAQSSFNKKQITLDLAKVIVEKFVKNTKKEISIDQIQKVVSDYFQMDVSTLQSKTRKRHIVQARQLAMFFSKKFTKASLASIGTKIGHRDHATVLHACKTVDNLAFTDKQFRKYVEDLDKKFTD